MAWIGRGDEREKVQDKQKSRVWRNVFYEILPALCRDHLSDKNRFPIHQRNDFIPLQFRLKTSEFFYLESHHLILTLSAVACVCY